MVPPLRWRNDRHVNVNTSGGHPRNRLRRWHVFREAATARRTLSHSGAALGSACRRCEHEHAFELHAGVPPRDRAISARLGVVDARHVFRRHYPHRRRADPRDVLPHRHRLPPRRLRRDRRHCLLRTGRRAGGEHLRHLERVPRRISAAKLFPLQAASAPHRAIVERNLDVPAGARLPGADFGDLFARLDRAVLSGDAADAARAAITAWCASPRSRARPG